MLRLFLLAAVAGVILLASFSLPAKAATLTVTSTADSGPGTLRNALLTAASGDTISITATGTITPLTELPGVDKSLVIFGPGAGSLTINGSSCGSCSGLSVVTGGSLSIFSVTIRNFTISGVHSTGNNVSVTNSVITQNTAGVKAMATQNAGGGIYATSGSISVLSSTVSGNSASRWGGGISAEVGTTSLNVSASTVDANSTPGQGGGVFTRASVTLMVNSTISGNTSGANQGGGIYNTNAITLQNVTVGDNFNGQLATGVAAGPITARNTIIARGGGGTGNNCTTTTFISQGNNISSDGTCPLTGTGDRINTNPLLLPLANNGGTTRTHLIATGSPAIDGGTSTGCPVLDQRNVTRPQDGNGDGTAVCDVGAVEIAAAVPPTPVPTAVPTTVPGGAGPTTPVPAATPIPTPAIPVVAPIIPQQVQNPMAVMAVMGGIGNGTRNNTPVPARPAAIAPSSGIGTSPGAMPVVRPPSTGDAGLLSP